MKEIELQKKAEELERTLDLQLKQLKKDSEVWLKIGGAILVIGLISYGVAKAKRHKKHTHDPKFEKEEQEVTRSRREWKKKPTIRKSSFLSSLKKRLFLTLLSYGEVRLMDALNRRRNEK